MLNLFQHLLERLIGHWYGQLFVINLKNTMEALP